MIQYLTVNDILVRVAGPDDTVDGFLRNCSAGETALMLQGRAEGTDVSVLT